MIRSFRGKVATALWAGQHAARFPADLVRIAQRKLRMVDAATTVTDLRQPPGNRLEPLRGDRIGQWSIRINDQWRVCFRWHDGNAEDVEIVDYH